MHNKLSPRSNVIGHTDLDLCTFQLKDVGDGVFVKPYISIVLDVFLGMVSQCAAISMDGHGLLIFPHTGYQLEIAK